MHKSIYPLLIGLVTFLMLLGFSSCNTDEEPDYPDFPDYSQEGNTGSDSKPNPTVNIAELVKQQVHATVSYSDYMMKFTITSTLEQALPNETIQYGIAHQGSSTSSEILVSVGNQAYSYSTTQSGNQKIITILNPFWFYYFAADEDMDAAAICQMYMKSYDYLLEKGSSSWSSEDKSLYDNLVRYLNEYELKARRNYTPIVECQVGNTFYEVNRFSVWW